MEFKKDFRKKFGKHALLSGIEAEALNYIPYGISTQSLCVDMAIGLPGIPGGRMTQITGLDGSGKSSLVQHLIAECQAMGGQAVIVDTEHTYDARRARSIGIDTIAWDVLEPKNIEHCLEMVNFYVENFFKGREEIIGKVPLLFAIDSMEGLPTEAQASSKPSDKFVGAVARIIAPNLPEMLLKMAYYKATIVIVSQQMTKIGGPASFYGPQYDTKGGLGLKYRASLRMVIQGKSSKANRILEDDSGVCIGFKNIVEVIKNKSADPFGKGDYNLVFSTGIDKYTDLLDAAVFMDILEVGGGGYYKGKIGKKELQFRKKEWPGIVDNKFRGPDRLRKILTKKAIKLGLMKRYDYEEFDLEGKEE